MKNYSPARLVTCQLLLIAIVLMPLSLARAQDPVTGAIEGYVYDNATKAPVADALVQLINTESGATLATRTNSEGYYRKGLLPPGEYRIRVTKDGYETPPDELFTNYATRPNPVRPPINMTATAAAVATASPEASPAAGQPPVAASPTPVVAQTAPSRSGSNIASEMNITDARRGQAYTDKEVSTLPLGGTTLTRSFDELGLLAPGVAPPPATLGSIAGPGVGAGVGSAGQFAVNGMRSRSNNFTVDGSDNNDEDIGVRRQGFFSLVPQPIESVKEFQITTLLAPAQYGRNVGAQVNALSKSGGNQFHGTVYGFYNSDRLNARDFFDTTNGNGTFNVTSSTGQLVRLDGNPLRVTNQSGGEDKYTLTQEGVALGGPIKSDKAFFFVSYEREGLYHATKEASFAVPTINQRGGPSCIQFAAGICTRTAPSGATGLFRDPFTGDPIQDFATTFQGDAVYSLFPFPNNPTGIYGANTYTEILPANARGNELSGKYDQNFNLWGKRQTLTARYNFTEDSRDIPVTGGALFSTLNPRVRTQNFSTFLNSEITSNISNMLRLSYGRTRLKFKEVRNPFLRPSASLPDTPFLLNAPRLLSDFLPGFGTPNTGVIDLTTTGTLEGVIGGPVGQVKVAGFSPVGVDVFNFPQSRVNNTYQLADTVAWRLGSHSLAFGADTRRTELNSDLCPNCRPLLTFNGAPRLAFNPITGAFTPNGFFQPTELVGVSAASGFSQSLTTGSSSLNLRYYQLDFFAQDEWRVRPNFSLSLGLRYEHNTPPREVNNKIESTFNSSALSLAPGFRQFIDGRTKIFDPDRNNFAPRVGFAWSPDLFGKDKSTVIRGGYGLFYDQILGAVVSQSRNVFPTFLNVNLAGGNGNAFFPFLPLDLLNPSDPTLILVTPGTLNHLDPTFSLQDQIDFINFISTSILQNSSGLSLTLPARRLQSPMAHQYSVTFDQQLSSNLVISAAYVGTLGRNLLRYTTPNLGPNSFLVPVQYAPGFAEPNFFGVAFAPGTRVSAAGTITGGRPVSSVGSVGIYETTGQSRYDALQLQARGRFTKSFQFQVNYTFSSVKDDVSDVFDLAGASALPQNSLAPAGEYAAANFDARHRISYDYVLDLPRFKGKAAQAVFGDIQLAGTGQFQTGQPFTVNSIYDVNLDGNLTDRLNSTSGIVETGDRSRPLRLTVDPLTLLAPLGQDGSVPRNSFRGDKLWLTNLAVIKRINLSEQVKLVFRTEVFNVFNRANFGIPVRFLEAPGFGQATDTVTPGRRIQFGLKLSF